MLIRICDRCTVPIVPFAASTAIAIDPALPATKQGAVVAAIDLIVITPTVQTPAGPGVPPADLCPLCLASALVVLAVQLGTANAMKPAQARRLAALFDALITPAAPVVPPAPIVTG
jgi:hypothetical protein